MKTLKIIHAADLHLDSPFEALGERAAQRRREQRALLGRIAELANDREADLLLLAGDLLDTGSAYAETGEALCEALGRVKCQVFIAPGNHDCFTLSSPYARLKLPGNVHVFPRAQMQYAELADLGARVWGAGYTDAVCPPLLRGFAAEKKPGVFDVCVLHGDVGARESRYCPVSEEEIASSGLDYLALGHVHAFSGLKKAGNTYYAYPGCPEGRGFDECGEKGVLYVELSGDGCRAEFVPVCMRKYEILTVDVSGGGAPELPEGTENDVCRILLTGECAAAPDAGRLEKLLKDRFFAVQVVDRTTLRRDVWERAQEDTLRGVFLRKLRAMYDEADGEERRKITQAARWGLAALDNGEAVSEL